MAKKNFARTSLKNTLNEAIGFTWPKAHTGKKNYVDFKVYDPGRRMLRRVKKHFDHIKGKREREAAMKQAVYILTGRLINGWNPFEKRADYSVVELSVIFEKYEATLSQFSRKKTGLDYKSRMTILKKYISELPNPPKYAYQLDRAFFVEYLDWLMLDRGVNARTRNNHKGWCSSFCDWMLKRDYIASNPMEGIEKVREDDKRRKALSSEDLKVLFNHLKKNDERFLLACLFQYYTLIRPTELSHLKIGDIRLKEQCVYVSGEFSKNRRTSAVSLNKQLIMLMLKLGIFNKPSEYYLFGSGFVPAPERIGPDQFNKRFAKVRKALKFDENIKFYSLKDSGIRDLANDGGIISARDQARHTDVATTNKYLQGRDQTGPEAAKKFRGAFDLEEEKKG